MKRLIWATYSWARHTHWHCQSLVAVSSSIWQSHTKIVCRIARFRATVSLATAVAVASALRYGVDHLSKGAVDPADGCGDSDEDVLAL